MQYRTAACSWGSATLSQADHRARGILTGSRLLVHLIWTPLLDLAICESGDVRGVELLVLDRGTPAQGAVATTPVVEDLQVLKERVGQLDAGLPPSPVEQLGLHPAPERLDDGVV